MAACGIGKRMKKKLRVRSTPRKSPDMLPEYDFDHRKAKPNRFAGRISKECVVVLNPEVSKVHTGAVSSRIDTREEQHP